MDDDGGDWFAGDADEPAQETPATPTTPTAAPVGNAAGTDEAPAVAEVPEDALPEPESEYLDPDKLILFKHWIRPKFLQYHYLYNYRHNYYDDVIDYLDKRQRGVSRDVPRAQTWAERALRTYTNKTSREEYSNRTAEDTKLVTYTNLCGEFSRYHTIQLVNRRFTSILY